MTVPMCSNVNDLLTVHLVTESMCSGINDLLTVHFFGELCNTRSIWPRTVSLHATC